MTNDLKDFIGTPYTSKTKILGSNVNSTASYAGTVKWRIEDDDGLQHEVILVFGFGQQYGYGHTGIRLVLPYHGYTGRRKKSHTVARMLDRGERVSPPL